MTAGYVEYYIKDNYCLLLQSDQFAAGLTALGFQRGDRVGIWSPNYYEWILAQYGTARAGIILVSICSWLLMLYNVYMSKK